MFIFKGTPSMDFGCPLVSLHQTKRDALRERRATQSLARAPPEEDGDPTRHRPAVLLGRRALG